MILRLQKSNRKNSTQTDNLILRFRIRDRLKCAFPLRIVQIDVTLKWNTFFDLNRVFQLKQKKVEPSKTPFRTNFHACKFRKQSVSKIAACSLLLRFENGLRCKWRFIWRSTPPRVFKGSRWWNPTLKIAFQTWFCRLSENISPVDGSIKTRFSKFVLMLPRLQFSG